MTARTLLAGFLLTTTGSLLHSQSLEKAEVTIPYAELKALLARGDSAGKPSPPPVLVSARLKLIIEDQRPVIDATFRVAGFGEPMRMVPLVSGNLSLDRRNPEDAVVTVEDDTIELAVSQAGTRTFSARLLPVLADGRFTLRIPPCASPILETGPIAPDHSVFMESGGGVKPLAGGQTLPLPGAGSTISFRFLNEEETREARRPPVPSVWSWQHQALVLPSEDRLAYLIVARATAEGGSGMGAELPLPPDARDVEIAGDDLASFRIVGGENRYRHLALTWKTRDILDRRVDIRYRMPLRPLDRVWTLQAPGGDRVTTRFIVATSSLLSLEAPGLSSPVSAEGLPKDLAAALGQTPCRLLEASHTAEIRVSRVPVAPTADGVATGAKWNLSMEPDGAMLATGEITIDHKGPLDFLFDTPEGMKLLDCEMDGKSVPPVDLGSGGLKVVLPPGKGSSVLRCSFTGSAGVLDPVEGTLKLTLPRMPLFIHKLEWQIDLPAGYQAETQGNVTRVPVAHGAAPWRIWLQKNLCRDERPEVNVFYQRADLNP